MFVGLKVPQSNSLVLSVDASSLRSISGAGNSAYNGAPGVVKNIENRTESITSANGLKLNNVNYYTAFGISYPEGSYGGSAANRQGITPGYNVTSGGKTYDASRSLHLWVWDDNTNTWLPDSYFHGLRLNGHCYDNYSGAETGYQNELNFFNSDFNTIKSGYTNGTWIVCGSHACSNFDSTTINNLISLGAPSSVISSWTDNGAWRDFVLVGKPGLGDGNAYGWAYQNYSTNPTEVAHLVFPLPLKGNKNSGFEFDGTNQYIQFSSGYANFTNGITINFVAKFSSSSGGWVRLMDFGNGSPLNNILFCRYSTTSNLFFGIYPGTGSVNSIGGTITFDTTQMYTAVADGTTYKIYVNGVLAQTDNYSTLPDNTTRNNCYIGKSNWSDPYFNGSIYSATIHNRALTDDEILQTYNTYKRRFGI